MGSRLRAGCRVALDLDDTLFVSVPKVVQMGNAFFGTEITLDEYQESWGYTRWREKYPDDEEWERKQGPEWTQHALDIGFYRDLPAMPGAYEALMELSELGVEFLAVTSRRREFTEDTFYSFGRAFPGVELLRENYFYSGAYDCRTDLDLSSRYRLTKGELLQRVGADVFVDDQIKHVISALTYRVSPVWFGKQSEAILQKYEEYAPFRGVDWPSSVAKIRRFL